MDAEQIQNYILIALGVLSAAVPLARHIAAMTANKTDDAAVERIAKAIHDVLGFLPTLQLGPALTLDQKQTLKDNK